MATAAARIGYLVGEPHRGLEYMFIMMNAARLSVGVQGVGLAELALQQAHAWAHSRVQGRPIGGASGKAPSADRASPGCARMLLTHSSQRRGHARAGAVRGAGAGSCARRNR